MSGSSTPGSISTRRQRIAELARRHAQLRSIAHHMDLLWMQEAYRLTRKTGAPGIDGVTAAEYAEDLEANLTDLLERAKSGRYRAPAVRRVHIPKGQGKTRPLGVPTFGDKVLQRSVVMLVEPIFEEDFKEFSYGFRRGRSAHDALRALHKGINDLVYARPEQCCWVLDADIEDFFGTIDHAHLREMLSARVGDGVIRRLVGKWLKAGVLEEGRRLHPHAGTPQGGVISPLLANIYLHNALDVWWEETVQPRLEAPSQMVRYADDFVMLFSRREDAERVLEVLGTRLAKYGLKLHPEKTRLIAFHRPRPGRAKPTPFTMLGITLHWGKSKKGSWAVMTTTSARSFQRGLERLSAAIKRMRHASLKRQSEYLRLHLRGHYEYFGQFAGVRALRHYMWEARGIWKKWLERRSQKAHMSWKRFRKIVKRYGIPHPTRKGWVRKGPRQLSLANW